MTSESDHRMPIWLDCDPGHDDAFAILLAATNPHFNLLGISTVHGNSSLKKVTNNALSLLTAFGKADIPVYPGASKPFMRPALHAPDIHGETGIDGTTLLPTPLAAPQSTPATLAMRNAIMSTTKNTCSLVVTGTMTNAALLFAAFPETAEHIKYLSIMGGAFTLGNITKHAEFNIYCDPESASSIFTLPALHNKIFLAPLDLTHTVLTTASVRSTLLAQQTTFRTMLHDLLMFFAATYERVFNMTEGPPLHDPLAVAVLLPQECGMGFEFDEGSVEVILAGEEIGRTILRKVEEMGDVNRHCGVEEIGEEGKDKGEGSGGVKVKVGRKVNVEKFWGVVMDSVGCADGVSPLNV
ncbi:Uridine nucleosidase 1 [Orbilia ellipsospora]|uniref:Uridine nucleosidase 1 n=1 Tax=Orbilia ellipsospora TaxID=2528407 RepID=A0AAV9WRL7_9PEZI